MFGLTVGVLMRPASSLYTEVSLTYYLCHKIVQPTKLDTFLSYYDTLLFVVLGMPKFCFVRTLHALGRRGFLVYVLEVVLVRWLCSLPLCLGGVATKVLIPFGYVQCSIVALLRLIVLFFRFY